MADKTPNDQNQNDTLWDTIVWWLAVAVAVLAIPSLGFVVVNTAHVDGMMGIAVFLVACWACVYLGTFIVKHPNMRNKNDTRNRS